MRRLDHGAPIRAAMKAAGMAIPLLAAKTQQIDPTGEGLSASYVGFIVGAGKTAREECSDRAAQLIAAALDQEVHRFFEAVVYTLRESTSTRRSKIAISLKTNDLPEQLMDQRELALFLRKSSSWIDEQIRKDPEWPGLIYVGRARRFNPIAVLQGQQDQRRQRTSA